MKIYIISIALGLSSISWGTTKASHLSRDWFPSDSIELERSLQKAQQRASLSFQASLQASAIHALIAPHAGLAYSGAVASAVYRKVSPSIKRIIILAPDHSGKHNGVAVSSFDKFLVPNGALAVDSIAKRLADKPNFSIDDDVFFREHSLEMQLPFVARYFPKANIIPLIVGTLDCNQAGNVAKTLKDYIDRDTLVVVTTDFIHYGERFNFKPFHDHQQLRIRRLNSQIVELIENGQCNPFENFMKKNRPTICGSNPIKVLLSLQELKAFGFSEPRLLAADTSSDKDDEDNVSYVGMIFTSEPLASLPIKKRLTEQEQRGLLQEAKDIVKHLFNQQPDKFLYFPLLSMGVKQALGAFTTLKQGSKNTLRGCIGRIMTDKPLYETIKTVTEDAALRDSRFSPVTKEELSSLNIEISVLSLPKPIADERSIVLGKHGIIWQLDGRSAVFLPQVPLEFGWDLKETLRQLAVKAGFPQTYFDHEKRTLEIFSTIDFE